MVPDFKRSYTLSATVRLSPIEDEFLSEKDGKCCAASEENQFPELIPSFIALSLLAYLMEHVQKPVCD